MEVGVKERFKKLVRNRLKWAGHVERMGDENLTQRDQMPRKWEREKGGEETENATGGLR